MSETGRKAAGELEVLRADEGFMTRLETYRQAKKAKAALKLAEMYGRSGMSDKAAEVYARVIADHPETEQALEAKAKLSALDSAASTGE